MSWLPQGTKYPFDRGRSSLSDLMLDSRMSRGLTDFAKSLILFPSSKNLCHPNDRTKTFVNTIDPLQSLGNKLYFLFSSDSPKYLVVQKNVM